MMTPNGEACRTLELRRRTEVLVIDDHLDTREHLCTVLRREGYVAVAVTDSIEAVELLMSMRPPSLVLLGLRTPSSDSLDAIAVLTSHAALLAIPALLLSVVFAATGLQLLQKPVPHEHLLRVAREHCPQL
jgi:CheY-like chemotaxis protein